MLYCDATFNSPAENLAADEALLDESEEGAQGAILRFWMPQSHFVVVGYANQVRTEVKLDFCRARQIPILRRCSGGGTVLQGPGCLNYALILRIEPGPLEGISSTNRFILNETREALAPLLEPGLDHLGDTDLAIRGLKIAGNAQRRRRKFLLFHGCLLLSLDLSLVAEALLMPSRQPAYREGRSHTEFMLNLQLDVSPVKQALRDRWGAEDQLLNLPHERIRKLVREKYALEEWNLKF